MHNPAQPFNRVAFPTEQELRALCGRLCDANPDKPRLKTIASVGAYDVKIGSDTIDGRRLTGLLAYLLHSGFLVDPDFVADPINFSDNRDFLKEDTQADLVFVSFILAHHYYNGTRTFSQRLKEYADSRPYSSKGIYGTALSDKHDKKEWNERIASSGAKMIVTYGGQDEISTHYLTTDHTNRPIINGPLTLLPTPKERVVTYAIVKSGQTGDTETNVDIKKIYNDSAADLPMPWLGFIATPEYLKQAAPLLSAETLLGRKAQEQAFRL